ncbi:ABC transporter, ATP-binding protein, partial [Cooperia oncophora]
LTHLSICRTRLYSGVCNEYSCKCLGLWQALSLALSNSFVVVNFAIAYAFGLWLIRNGWSRPFTVFQVIEALNMASMSVMMAASYFPEYIRARISAGVMFTMMRQRPKIDNMSHQGEKPALKGDISLRNVYFAYPVRTTTAHPPRIEHECPSRTDCGTCRKPVVAGKSTVIQLVERLLRCIVWHRGEFCRAVLHCIFIASTHTIYVTFPSVTSGDNMALVGQEPTLFNVTIRENIMYGLDKCSQEEMEYAARLANIHDFIVSLPESYSTVVGAKGGLLSGGQKQRIAIARAIVRDPKILLLDEATSALDTESEKVVQEALDRARQGRTCLVIAHRLSTIQNADLIVVCRDGRVAEHGTHQALLARKGIYYKLVERQNR